MLAVKNYQNYASPEIIDWLLEGDPAVRWQVQRDLLVEKPTVYEATQAAVAEEGWGARLLALQAADGRWGGGLYSPKWISTHYTLYTLWRLGLPADNAQAIKAARLLLDQGFLNDHGINFSSRADAHAETCISGMLLAMLSYFNVEDERVHLLAEHMLQQQMGDQGWNCRSYKGDTHSSFNTTNMALEGLLEYELKYPKSKLPIRKAMQGGQVFFLAHHLFQSHHTGEVVKESMLRFPFPGGWQYDFLKGLDHFQGAKARRDGRAQDAINLLLSKRDGDGRWPQYRGPSGQQHFQIESVGKPSRMNTLRALRVLKWWLAD